MSDTESPTKWAIGYIQRLERETAELRDLIRRLRGE